MSLPLAIALDNVETHQSEFSRGYHLGYVRACAHQPGGGTFTTRLPERYLGEVVRLLKGTGSDFAVRVYHVEPPNQYGTRFVRIRVHVPGPEIFRPKPMPLNLRECIASAS